MLDQREEAGLKSGPRRVIPVWRRSKAFAMGQRRVEAAVLEDTLMIRIKNRSVSVVALLSIAIASSAAMAIGPQYQVIGDPVAAGAGPLNDVVSLVNAGGIELGTGSLIGVSTPAPGGLTFMSILTARHVAVDAVKTARFGVGPGEAGAPGAGAYPLIANLDGSFVGFTLVDPVNNPNNRREDLAIMLAAVKVPAGGAALAEYNKVVSPANIFLLSPFPTAPPRPVPRCLHSEIHGARLWHSGDVRHGQ